MTKDFSQIDGMLERYMSSCWGREKQLQSVREVYHHPDNLDIRTALRGVGFFDAKNGDNAWRHFSVWADRFDAEALALPPERQSIAHDIVANTRKAFEHTKDALAIEGEILRSLDPTKQSKTVIRATLREGHRMARDVVNGYKEYEASPILRKAIEALKTDMHVELHPIEGKVRPASMIEAYFRHEPIERSTIHPVAEPKGNARNWIIGSAVAAVVAAGAWMVMANNARSERGEAVTR